LLSHFLANLGVLAPHFLVSLKSCCTPSSVQVEHPRAGVL
jgi:hypothetical protein